MAGTRKLIDCLRSRFFWNGKIFDIRRPPKLCHWDPLVAKTRLMIRLELDVNIRFPAEIGSLVYLHKGRAKHDR